MPVSTRVLRPDGMGLESFMAVSLPAAPHRLLMCSCGSGFSRELFLPVATGEKLAAEAVPTEAE